MGTNYYWLPTEERECPTCHREHEGLHIGKSSAGWCFSLHVIPDLDLNTLADWMAKFSTGAIFDENDKRISVEDMLVTITQRSWPHPRSNDPDNLSENHAKVGPNNLRRHAYCANPGDGTYDLCEGEFS